MTKPHLLSADQVRENLETLVDWTYDGGALVREEEFPTFRQALEYVYALGLAAEEVDHHPDIDIRYKTITVRYSTHSAGGVTELDLEGARTAEDLIAPAKQGGDQILNWTKK